MVVISKMAHEVDLGLAERQIGHSLNSGMLHQEDAVYAAGIELFERVGVRGVVCLEYPLCRHVALSQPF